MNIPIVNMQDEITDYKPRTAVDYSRDIFRTASLWITNSNDEVLLAQRKHDKKVDPGKWAEAVGGTVENHDSYEETIIREAEEELGIIGIQITKGPKQLITTPCHYFVQWYTTIIDKDVGQFTVQPEEVEKIAWIPKEQLLRDIDKQPEKYIDAMRDIVGLFNNGPDSLNESTPS